MAIVVFPFLRILNRGPRHPSLLLTTSQVTVESVHVRYEQIDTSGTTIAAGVTLDGFTV